MNIDFESLEEKITIPESRTEAMQMLQEGRQLAYTATDALLSFLQQYSKFEVRLEFEDILLYYMNKMRVFWQLTANTYYMYPVWISNHKSVLDTFPSARNGGHSDIRYILLFHSIILITM